VDAAIAALQRLRGGLDEAFEETVKRLLALHGKVLTLGVGKSGHAAQKVAATLRSVGIPAIHLSPSDSLHGDLGMICPGDLALLFSKSGATSELLAVTPHLRSRGVTLVAVTGSVSSPLALEADLVLDASVESEGCPLEAAPMASVLVAQALGDALAAAVIEIRGFTAEDFARLHPAGALGTRLTLTVAHVMRQRDDLPRIGDRASLKEAVLEITRTGYGAVCVLDDQEHLVGFVTDGDIRRALVEVDNLAKLPVTELMTTSPLVVSPELLLSEALLKLEQRRKPFLTAPVVRPDGRCVGLLRLHDVVRAHLPA
jgi:arabinose-5-phosphate isomerase